MTNEAGPNVVYNGLVLYLDAANKRSFNPSENLLTYTNSIGITGQKYANGAAVINTLNAESAPDGTLTATKIDNNGNSTANYTYSQGDVALSTSTTYTYSIFLKSFSSNLIYITLDENDFGGKRYQLYFNLSNKTVTTQTIGTQSDGAILSSGVVEYPNQWYRVYITFTTGSTNVSSLVDFIGRFSTSNVGYNYFWGRQLEKGPSMTDYTPVLTTGIISRPTTFTDLSASKISGNLISGTTYLPTNSGNFVLNGTSSYITLPNFKSSFNFNSPFTISAWINKTNTNVGDVVSIFTPLPSDDGIWLEIGQTTNQIRFASRNMGVTVFNLIPTEAISINTWQNIVATFDGATAKIYLNSIQLGTTASATTLFSVLNNDLTIGRLDSSFGRYFSGSIGPVFIYSRALTSSEISQNYNALKGRYGL